MRYIEVRVGFYGVKGNMRLGGKEMRVGPWVSVSIWALTLNILLSGTGVVAQIPGPGGELDIEVDYWLADPGWCALMEENDVNETTWMTGLTVYNLSYREDLEDGWNRYVAEMTIPWIGIRMTGGNMVHYEFSDETSAYHIYYDGQSATVHSYTEQEPYTSIDVDYVLDFDGDSNNEWKFKIHFEFNPPVLGETGYFKMEFQVTQFPQNWIFNQTAIHLMEIPFMVNPDVYDNGANDYYYGSDSSWTKIHDESTYDGSTYDAKSVNDLPNPDVELIFSPIPQGCNPSLQNFTFLTSEYCEYARCPSDYDNDGGMEGIDGLIWYVETYSVQTNPPPNANNGGWTGMMCEGFVA